MSPDPASDQATEETSLLNDTANPDTPASDAPSERPLWSQLLHDTWHVLTATWNSSLTNYLLPCVPLGIVADSLGWSSATIFVFNFLAMLPLASLMSYSTEELSKSVGQTIGVLINTTFGNAVEMIVSHALKYSPSFSMFFLTWQYLGGHYSPQQRRDQHCPVQHGRQHSIRNPARKSRLLPTHLSKMCLSFHLINPYLNPLPDPRHLLLRRRLQQRRPQIQQPSNGHDGLTHGHR